MAYTFEIESTGTWFPCRPIYDKNSFVRKRDDEDIAVWRDSIEGVFKFSDYNIVGELDYSFLYQAFTLGAFIWPFRVKLNGVVIFTGYLDLYGKYDIHNKICELRIINDKDYYEKILKSLSQSINIVDCNDKKAIYLSTPNVYYNYNYFLTDVMKFMINYIDPLITFDANSFSILDNNSINGTRWSALMVGGISDVVGQTIVSTVDRQTILNVTLSNIFDFLRNECKIYWSINSTGVFKLIHSKDLFTGSSPTDLTNLYSKNWTTQHNAFSIKKNKQYRLVQREIVADNIDFKGFDISISKFLLYGEIKKTSVIPFFDIEDIRVDAIRTSPRRYNQDDINSLVWWQTKESTVTTDKFVQNCAGGEDVTKVFQVPYANEKFEMYRSYDPSPVQYQILMGDSLFQPVETTTGVEYFFKIKCTNLAPHPFTKIYIRPFYDVVNDEFWCKIKSGATINFDSGDGAGITKWIDLTAGGDFSFSILGLKLDTSFDLDLYIAGGDEADAPDNFFELNIATGETQIITEKYYECEKHNVKDTTPRYNGYLSLAYIDRTFGLYEQPDTSILINGETTPTTAAVSRIKDVDEIHIPSSQLSDIDFDELITTDAGYMLPTEFIVKLDGSPATIKGIL